MLFYFERCLYVLHTKYVYCFEISEWPFCGKKQKLLNVQKFIHSLFIIRSVFAKTTYNMCWNKSLDTQLFTKYYIKVYTLLFKFFIGRSNEVSKVSSLEQKCFYSLLQVLYDPLTLLIAIPNLGNNKNSKNYLSQKYWKRGKSQRNRIYSNYLYLLRDNKSFKR